MTPADYLRARAQGHIQSAMSAAMNFKKCGSVLITGASRGLGLQLVDSMASGQFSPGKIIATCRNPGNAQVNTNTKLGVRIDGVAIME